MGDYDTFIVIVGIIIAGIIIYNLWLANHQKKQLSEQLEQCEQFLQLKDRECAIYRNIIAQWEQRLFQKTRKIPQEWIKQWDEEVRYWERSILEIKSPGDFSESKGQWPLMIKDICMQGYGEAWFLYGEALTKELTAEHTERINELMMCPIFKKIYRKVVRLMRQNGIKLREFVDPFTRKKRYKPTTLLLHWCLYVVDDMLKAEYEQQQKDKASGCYEELASMEIYYKDLPKYTEYETLEEILPCWYYNMPGDSELLCIYKRELLSLLYDISSDYKKARETFIYYKQLIDTVKEGYMAFDENCRYSTVRYEIDTCKERDKEKKKGLRIAKETPTFEKAYKLGAREWMKVSNKKCDNQWIFWKMLVEIGNSQEKLKIIFGDEKVKKLEEVIKEDQQQVASKMQAAVFENKDFCYYKSRGHYIDYLK
ncbi:hypothetical protein [Bartonella tribocorum]|uniref:Uncharacterized protein n=1 Tax=Bartonella tribocorum (strain DSM 28219 / CCUG 45778 / CIP 105476 / IBS 506) TaxID=382640 RepID=A9IYP8_BART1|nr:hypothetical protein [Bartonella tribocorum]CAK02402.1 hypothetical protein predicted by Glimmer/Critica [Bartonella tribocorum CIP 105476]CDO49740.1 hypothetical protein BM1374166_02097 [Bartonella tribocorum]